MADARIGRSAATRGSLLAWFGLIAVGLAANVTGLRNQFVQDDLSVIAQNPAVHSLAHPGTFFTTPYWPKPYRPANYRPLATTGFALQWVAGGGAPWVFHAVSIAIYIVAGLAVWRLANLLLPRLVAWVVAALFLAHPVHVEAVALGVNQSELVVGAIAALMAGIYVRAGTQERLTGATQAGLVALFGVALLFKESGLVLIALPIAAEVTLGAGDRPWGHRLNSLRNLTLVLLLEAAIVFAVRSWVLAGDVLGTPVAEVLKGLSLSERALTMLGVVPHWGRLLLWPAHLRADYTPSEIVAAVTWGPEQTLGLALLVAGIVALALSWRRLPVLSFALLWTAIGIFPVSNVVVPTGVVLAERTLFLPSIGALLGFGALVAAGVATLRARQWGVAAIGAAGVGLLVMGVSRSASRQRVWRDEFTLWRQTVVDAPRSSRAHHGLAELLFQRNDVGPGEREYRQAVALATTDWAPALGFADRLRSLGRCEPATSYYRMALALESKHEGARSKLILCLMELGRYREAGVEAREASRLASRPEVAAVFRRMTELSDSGVRSNAAPGAVKFSMPPESPR